jgi:hypothetical protein
LEKVNNQILMPAAVQHVIGELAGIWRMSAEDAKTQIESNQWAIWRFAGAKNQ